LELSGINRLLAIAQELGVGEAKSVGRPNDSTREIGDRLRDRTAKSQDDTGLKVSLSAEASRLAEGLTTPPASAPFSTPATNQLEPNRAAIRSNTDPSDFRRSRVVAAYQKNASANPGDRIRVIA
jgi:hypothetical protein